MDVAFYSEHLKNWVSEKRPITQAEKRPDLAVVFRNDEPRREAQYPNGWILLAHISPAATFPQPYRLP
jgi:hypothetical protein